MVLAMVLIMILTVTIIILAMVSAAGVTVLMVFNEGSDLLFEQESENDSCSLSLEYVLIF